MERTLASIRAAKPSIDRSVFDATSEEDIERQALEDGEVPPDGQGDWRVSIHPGSLRDQLGMSQDVFAAALGVPVGLVQDWEAGRILPDAPSRSLLLAVSRDPKTVFQLIGGRAA